MAPKRKSKFLAEAMTPRASLPVREGDCIHVAIPKALENPRTVATPKAVGTPRTVATPKAVETPRTVGTPATVKPSLPPESEILGDLWTEDQTSSLFKAIIRWKPSGMHKHFRMIAISEHLRNHGIDPTIETHTRIPGIWKKLRQFFDMDMIDERDNSFDYVRSLGGDESPEEIYKDFELPPEDFHDLMWARAAADENEPDNWTDSNDDDDSDELARSTIIVAAPLPWGTITATPTPTPTGTATTTTTTTTTTTATKKQGRKRKRADTETGSTIAVKVGGPSAIGDSITVKVGGSSAMGDTDRDTPVISSPAARGTSRRGRSRKRIAIKAVGSEREYNGEEEVGAEGDEGESDDSSSEDDDVDAVVVAAEVPVVARPASRGGRGRGRGRARGKGGGRKKT
ncbi:chromatin modification-related protein EAF7-domain-containing protein [Xylaria sp. CBS 124048]|nr:chromatin modification-related protein EAF7-domain-containing protein [Xylaria sp. CBS 124048]